MRHVLVVAVFVLLFQGVEPGLANFATAQEEETFENIDVAIGALVKAASDANPEVRYAAFQALERIQASGDDVMQLIQDKLLDPDSDVREMAMQVLIRQEWDEKTKGKMLVRMLLSDQHEIVLEAASRFDGQFQSDVIDDLLALLLADKTSQQIKSTLLNVLARNESELPRVLPALEKVYQDADTEQKILILRMLGNYGAEATSSLKFVAGQAGSADDAIRLVAIESIRRIMPSHSSRSSRSFSDRQEKYVDGLFDRYDSNRDGVIDGAELTGTRALARFDTDGNGRVTRREIGASMQSGRR